MAWKYAAAVDDADDEVTLKMRRSPAGRGREARFKHHRARPGDTGGGALC